MTIKPDYSQSVPADLGKVHFIGIGGSGMSGIARILLGMGHKVTGSDLRDTGNVAALRELDEAGALRVWVEQPPASPEWDGVRDRLSRAAADGSPPL